MDSLIPAFQFLGIGLSMSLLALMNELWPLHTVVRLLLLMVGKGASATCRIVERFASWMRKVGKWVNRQWCIFRELEYLAKKLNPIPNFIPGFTMGYSTFLFQIHSPQAVFHIPIPNPLTSVNIPLFQILKNNYSIFQFHIPAFKVLQLGWFDYDVQEKQMIGGNWHL